MKIVTNPKRTLSGRKPIPNLKLRMTWDSNEFMSAAKKPGERPISFTPTSRQLEAMLRLSWKTLRFSSIPADAQGKFDVSIVFIHRRTLRDDYQSHLGFVFDTESDLVEIHTNVDYLDIFGEEIDADTTIPNDSTEETEISFQIRGKGKISLFKIRSCEGFQVFLD